MSYSIISEKQKKIINSVFSNKIDKGQKYVSSLSLIRNDAKYLLNLAEVPKNSPLYIFSATSVIMTGLDLMSRYYLDKLKSEKSSFIKLLSCFYPQSNERIEHSESNHKINEIIYNIRCSVIHSFELMDTKKTNKIYFQLDLNQKKGDQLELLKFYPKSGDQPDRYSLNPKSLFHLMEENIVPALSEYLINKKLSESSLNIMSSSFLYMDHLTHNPSGSSNVSPTAFHSSNID